MHDIPRYRLLMLRAYYLLIGVGTIPVFWPSLIAHTDQWGIESGAHYSLLSALSPLALLGVRYPLKMLPIVLYEFLWKLLWILFIFVPLWRHGAATEQVWSNLFACGLSIVLTPMVLPWRHVWRTYVSVPAD